VDLQIARHGYGDPLAPNRPLAAFFPGFPYSIRAIHMLGIGYTWAAVLIGIIGIVAACCRASCTTVC